MKFYRFFPTLAALLLLVMASSCGHIDNKVVPRFTVRIDLGNIALWNTYGVYGMGDYRIFDRSKGIPSNFPFTVNTYTGYGGVLLMMGMEGPMAYDLSCPVEASQNITLSISSDNFEAVCPRCGSHYDPLMNAGSPVKGVAIYKQVGMRQYRVIPSGSGYVITN